MPAASPVATAEPVPEPPPQPFLVVMRAGERLTVSLAQVGNTSFQDGDTITVEPAELASQLAWTPDGCVNIADGSQRYRIPPHYRLSSHKGFLFPEHLVILTGAGTDTLDPIGRGHIRCYRASVGLSEDMVILEIGCGIGRDALQFMNILSKDGRYIGVDVTCDSIEWCRKNITPKFPNFSFHHFDAQHELYNPLGKKTSFDFRLPADDQSVDRICAGSVFTHLFEDEIVHYMREIARVLKPSGRAYTTFFLYSDETIEAARRTNLTPNNLMFEHAYGDGCYVNDAQYPTGAVAFTEEAIRRMAQKAGLRLMSPLIGGAWSGYYADAPDGQEAAILGV